jgi:hypothetical protein
MQARDKVCFGSKADILSCSIFHVTESNEAAGPRAARPLRRGVFVSAKRTAPRFINSDFDAALQRLVGIVPR